MIICPGKYYMTTNGQVVGPIIHRGNYFLHFGDNGRLDGLWGMNGKTSSPETHTAYLYGDLVQEVVTQQ